MRETDNSRSRYGYTLAIRATDQLDPSEGPSPGVAWPGGGREFEVRDYLDGGWVVAYRIAEQDGAPVLAGIEIRPGLRPHPAASAYGGSGPSNDDAPMPLGGLTARQLRQIRPGQALAEARRRLHFLRDHHPDMLGDHRFGGDGPPKSGRRDQWYAHIAALYIDAAGKGSHRLRAEVVEALGAGYSENYVRDVIFKARDRGILTGAGQGRVGGHLTDYGKRLLDGRS